MSSPASAPKGRSGTNPTKPLLLEQAYKQRVQTLEHDARDQVLDLVCCSPDRQKRRCVHVRDVSQITPYEAYSKQASGCSCSHSRGACLLRYFLPKPILRSQHKLYRCRSLWKNIWEASPTDMFRTLGVGAVPGLQNACKTRPTGLGAKVELSAADNIPACPDLCKQATKNCLFLVNTFVRPNIRHVH